MVLRPANVAQRAVFVVVAIDPLETAIVEVDFVQGLLAAQEAIQVGDALLQALVRGPLQQIPL